MILAWEQQYTYAIPERYTIREDTSICRRNECSQSNKHLELLSECNENKLLPSIRVQLLSMWIDTHIDTYVKETQQVEPSEQWDWHMRKTETSSAHLPHMSSPSQNTEYRSVCLHTVGKDMQYKTTES